MKTLVPVALLCGLVGCRATPVETVNVYLYPDGHLDAGKITVPKEQIPALAKEFKDGSVAIHPAGGPTDKLPYDAVATVRDQFKAAGVKCVAIGIGGK